MIGVKNFETTWRRRHVNIQVNPCMYDLATETLRVATELEYTVTPIFSSEPVMTEEQLAVRNEKMRRTKNALISLMSAEQPYGEGEALYITDGGNYTDVFKSYLIITCDKYLEAANELALLKKKMGYTTYISSRNTWNADQITDSIKKYYGVDVDLESVILLGGYKDLPSPFYYKKIDRSSYEYASDFYYGCINGKTQDVLLGRIPVNSLDELKTVIFKIGHYFYDPPCDEYFYKTGIHVAVCEGGSVDYDNHIKDAEIARDIAVSEGWDVTRLYASPDTRSKKYYDSGEEMPGDLQPSNYSWIVNKNDIINEIDLGASYVLYRGHGAPDEWIFPKFNITDFPALYNRDLLPVFFNSTCWSGAYFFNEPCFAEKILKLNNGGAIGVIAGSEKTRIDFNHLAAPEYIRSLLVESKNAYFFNSDIPLIDADAKPSSSVLGKILQNSFRTAERQGYPYTQEHKEIYHLFGDPSMTVYTSYPRNLSSYELWRKKNYKVVSQHLQMVYSLTHEEVQINLADEACFVGIYDKEEDLSFLVFGKRMSFPYFDPVRYEMTIYSPHIKPITITTQERTTKYLVAPTPVPYLTISPNPVSTYAQIKYHFQTSSLDNVSGEIQIQLISTGYIYDRFNVCGPSGQVAIDPSRYISGEYLVTLIKKDSNGNDVILSTEKMIVRK